MQRGEKKNMETAKTNIKVSNYNFLILTKIGHLKISNFFSYSIVVHYVGTPGCLSRRY